jgi:hypothetical protein
MQLRIARRTRLGGRDSYLINKLLGVDMCTGTQMPKADQSLAADDIQRISDWICQGALPN